MNKEAALMLTRQYKETVSAAHEMSKVFQKVDHAANELSRMINSPIDVEAGGRHDVSRATSNLAYQLDTLGYYSTMLRNVIIDVDVTINKKAASDSHIAGDLVRLAREMVASDLDDFLQAWKSGDYSYMGFYSGKTRPTKSPNNFISLQPFTQQVEERARQMVVEPKRFVKTQDYAFFTFVGTAGRTDTYLLSKKPLAELFPDAVPVRKRVYEIAEDVKRKLSDMGLQSLGTRYGKAGEQFGEPDSARRIGIGGRDFLYNTFMVQIDDEFSFKKPTIGWRMKDVVLLSAVTDEIIEKAVAWVKAGRTMQQVRDEARNIYVRKVAEKPGERNYVVVYG